jgi:peptidoglycan hydrolase-like protein with peptidoglycan-binding domain
MAVLAANLAMLRREIDARWPKRDKRTDGWIGDADHQARKSDHNPDKNDVVHAIDVDKDGIDPDLLVRQAIRHPTVQYVIFNHTIWSRRHGFKSQKYTGPNPHTEHVHISGRYGGEFENSHAVWGVATSPITQLSPLDLRQDKPGSRTLRLTQPRMRGEDVLFAQRFIGPKRTGTPDGIFGPNTEAGVRWYQQMRGIEANGVCDTRTFRQMGIKI